MHTGCRVFIRKETRTYLNTHVPRVALFFDSVSTLTLKSSHKTMRVGAHRGAHEIKFHESSGISICNQVSSRLKVVPGFSLVFNRQVWGSKTIGT
jgi:hypothetical protein